MTVAESVLGRGRRPRAWSDDERNEVWAALQPEMVDTRSFAARFVTLSVLSTVLAAFGLITNSVATVIAGMLLDPLMTPVLAIAANILHGRPRRLMVSLLIVTVGTLVAIVTGWLVAAISPAFTSVQDVAPELLMRTSPRLADLGVAVAAGLSAGYVLTHREASSVLPGVAVAIALVPPLAAVGVLLNVGADHEAAGALLLYATNLGAIVVSAIVVLAIAGFLPTPVERQGRLPFGLGLVVSVVALVLIIVPLARQTSVVIEQRGFRREVGRAVNEWDPAARSVEITTDTGPDPDEAQVVLTADHPASVSALAKLINERTGDPVRVSVEFRTHTTEVVTVR